LILYAVLKTGVTPSASGSAYLELESPSKPKLPNHTFLPPSSSLKISCTVHGPRPLPRSAPFNSSLLLTTHVKFAPFAARHRRGYVRDSTERDLGAHLETALRGVVIGDRWPKSGVDVVITVLEGEEDRWCGDEASGGTTGIGAVGGWGMMNVLAGCITVSSAAIIDAGIDCVDLVTGGVAAVVQSPLSTQAKSNAATDELATSIILDPSPPEHAEIGAACVVAYLAERDEITEMWLKGDAGISAETLVDRAVAAAVATRSVLVETVMETAKVKFPELNPKSKKAGGDTDMTG
jgi:exosome complex component MTR3